MKLRCPSCGDETISVLVKAYSTRWNPVACHSCGARVYARGTMLAGLLLTPLTGIGAFLVLLALGLGPLVFLAALVIWLTLIIAGGATFARLVLASPATKDRARP